MSKNKNAVKRTAAKHDPVKSIMTQVKAYNVQAEKEGRPKLLLFDEISYERERHELRHFTRVWMMDMASLALGRMGFREKRFKQLDETLLEVTKEYDKEFEEDIKDDPDMIYSRAALDRELKQYMGKMFVPEEMRYR